MFFTFLSCNSDNLELKEEVTLIIQDEGYSEINLTEDLRKRQLILFGAKIGGTSNDGHLNLDLIINKNSNLCGIEMHENDISITRKVSNYVAVDNNLYIHYRDNFIEKPDFIEVTLTFQ